MRRAGLSAIAEFLVTYGTPCVIAAIVVVACLSHAGIVSKRIKIPSNFFNLCFVVPPLWFSTTSYGCEHVTRIDLDMV